LTQINTDKNPKNPRSSAFANNTIEKPETARYSQIGVVSLPGGAHAHDQ
jgi:hypothetical protein